MKREAGQREIINHITRLMEQKNKISGADISIY